MKVLMAEDLEAVRVHIGELLAGCGDIELRFVAQDSSQLMKAVAEWRPEVAIVDTRMRVMLALGVLEVLKREWPDMAVVVAALIYQPYYRAAYRDRGADFFFDKSVEWGELVEFLRTRQAWLASVQPKAALAAL